MSVLSSLVPLGSRLVETSLWGGVAALVVLALCRAWPTLPANARCWLWWGVSLRLVVGLLPLPAVAVPVLSPRAAATVLRAPITSSGVATVTVPRAPEATSSTRRPPSPDRAPAEAQLSWQSVLVAIWLAGAAVAVAATVHHLRRARRVRVEAAPVDDGELATLFAALCARLGVRAELRLSAAAATPQVVGLLRPVVLLPASMAKRLRGDERTMVLAHELLHVRRSDLLRGIVPALATRVLFFHPLAHLAAREHALAREEACDAAVVARIARSPRAYGRLLLELALDGGPALRAAAAATHPSLERRLRMLLHPSRSPLAAWLVPVVLVAAGVLVPLRLTARESTTRLDLPEARVTPMERVTPHAQLARAVPGALPGGVGGGVVLAASGADHDSYIYLRGDEISMSGDEADIHIARRLRHGNENLLWVRRDDGTWVVRDPAILARVDALFAPQEELGRQQAELGAQQAELGARQSELGAQQAELGAQQAKLGAEQATLSAQAARLSAERSRVEASEPSGADERSQWRKRSDEIDAQQEELDRKVDELSRRQDELGKQQSALGDRQGELGDRQSKLGDQQGELGKRQEEASRKAERQLQSLLDEAIRDGKAERQ